MKPFRLWGLALAVLSLHGQAALAGPEAPGRSYGQNYKDMVLAGCLARAYKGEPTAGRDAAATAGVFVEWSRFNLEKSMEPMDRLIDAYLARDYRHPLAEYQGVDFSLLKCLDLYHGKELDNLVKRFVPDARRTFRQDHPPIKP